MAKREVEPNLSKRCTAVYLYMDDIDDTFDRHCQLTVGHKGNHYWSSKEEDHKISWPNVKP